jgi:oligoendopeptidase F
MTSSVPSRRAVPAERTWDVASVFADDAAWEAGIAQLESMFPEVASFSGTLDRGAGRIADFYELFERFYRLLGRIFVYASAIHNVDTAEPDGIAKNSRVRTLFGRAAALLSFSDPELLSLGDERLRQLPGGDPRLERFGHYFDNLLREQEHVRSQDVEEILGLVGDPLGSASSIHSVLTDTDMHFAPARGESGSEIEVVQGNYDEILNGDDREARRTAWESYADAHLAFANTEAACLSTGVKRDVFFARARQYGSSLESALSPSNIPVDVFHNLIGTYRRSLPIWHRYWRVRRKALGVDALHPYDVWAPLGTNPPKVTYEEAVDLISEGMAPLGTEYVDVLRRGCLEQRWVDVYPNLGKTSGAYSDGFPGTHPFILMSFTDDVGSLSTLAHELGHSMHSYFTWRNQPIVYDDYSMFVAETASNFNQAMVRAHLVKARPDDDFQLALIAETMDNFHRYFFIMPALARLELEIHERIEQGGALTADYLTERMAELFSEGYGGEMEFDQRRLGITWAEFSSHMYGNFYVFQYATGISAANALARGVLDEGEPAAARYLDFLKSGASLYPIDALALAGVDMRTPEPVERAFQVLSETVDRLEAIVDRRAAQTKQPAPSG